MFWIPRHYVRGSLATLFRNKFPGQTCKHSLHIFEEVSYPLRFDEQGLATIAGWDLTLVLVRWCWNWRFPRTKLSLSPKVGMGSRQSRPMNEDETESGLCSTYK